MESDNNANRVLASVKEQELQFERLTRELEMERQIVATQLERCRLGSESPGAASASSSEKSLPWKSTGNSRSSTQMNSYSDSGYQDAVSYHDTQMQGKSELRVQHSFPGSVGSFRPSRAEGQAARQGSGVTAPSQLRRDGSMSIPYNFRVSTSRGSLRGTASYGYPILTEPSTFTSTSLSGVSQKNSPENRRTRSSLTHSHSGRTTSPGSPPLGSVGADGQQMFTLPPRAGMTAVPEHYESMKPRTFLPDGSEPYSIYSYENYGRIPTFTGVGALSSSPHGWSAAEPWSVTPTDGCVTLVYEGETFQRPQYHEPHTALYRSSFGVGNLQRSSSQCSSATYRKHYNSSAYWPAEPGYMPVVMDDEASVDSMQKNPREILWRDPELLEVIIMLQHQFPSVQANAAAYLQHLCYKDSRVKNEVFRLGGIKHLVELLDHKVLEVHRHACGALRNLVYGRATDNNKIAVEKEGGIPALLKLLRDTVDSEVRELVTGVLWNLSSCEHLKIPIIRDALGTLTNVVIVPHSGWDSGNFHHEHKLKFHSSLVLRNTTGCLRNLSSAGQEALKCMRRCEGLVDSLLHVITACDSTPEFDSKIVENCICTLRNLSYQLELEMPPSCLIPCVELEKLPEAESPGKKRKCCLWGRKKRKKSSSLKDHWDGVGPIPGFSESPRGAERLWHPSVVKPYLTLLAESSNPVTLEASAGSLQNLSAGKWKFSAYIRAAVRKEKGLPILVELLRMDNDRVVCSIATALRNMALDVRNKELIGKYAMKDLVNRLPGGYTTLLSDDTVAAVCRTLHEVTSRNMENAKALADTGGIEKLVDITKGRGESGSSMKVVKTAAQVLNTLWQYKDLRNLYKKDGWNQNHFLTPVSSLERQHFTSQPTLPSSSLQRPLQSFTPESATTRRPSQTLKTPSAAPYPTENSRNIKRTGSGNTSPFHSELYVLPARETSRQEVMYYSDKARHRSYDTDPRSALTRDYTPLHFSSEYGQTRGFRSPYGDFYPPSPDSWV